VTGEVERKLGGSCDSLVMAHGCLLRVVGHSPFGLEAIEAQRAARSVCPFDSGQLSRLFKFSGGRQMPSVQRCAAGLHHLLAVGRSPAQTARFFTATARRGHCSDIGITLPWPALANRHRAGRMHAAMGRAEFARLRDEARSAL
jgi:hypothetical protein